MAQGTGPKEQRGNAPRKHHYVPVFYQGKFADSEGLLWVYDRVLGTYKHLHPNVICFKKDLYSVRSQDGPPDTRVESKILGFVDGLGAQGIREIEAGKAFRDEARGEVAFFAAFQWTRLPSISRDVSATYARALEEVGRIMFANVDRAKSVMESYKKKTGLAVTVSPESMVEAVQGKHLHYTTTEIPFLTNMMEQAVTLSEVIGKLRWEILVASEETGFIICDAPVVVVPPKGNKNIGFLVPGTVKYFPLTRSLCLRLGEPGLSTTRRNVDRETVRIINQNIAANSERFIMGPEKAQLETIVVRSESTKMETTPRFIVETFQADDDGSLQKISTQPRRYFYPKNGSVYAP